MASFPQIYSNNKKGRESDKTDPKKLWKKLNKWINSFVYVFMINWKREKRVFSMLIKYEQNVKDKGDKKWQRKTQL